jgi:amino acid transporter
MAIAGLCALLSCLIYAEFSSGWPVAGGSYTFVALTMGELTAFLVVRVFFYFEGPSGSFLSEQPPFPKKK